MTSCNFVATHLTLTINFISILITLVIMLEFSCLHLGSLYPRIFTKWRNYEMKRNSPFLLEIQNKKWKYPIYEMKKSNLRNETFLYYYKICKIRNEMSNLRNGLVVFRKYVIYEMTKVTKENVQFTKWTCGFQKICNLRNDQIDKWKCPIYEMYLWFSKNIQFTKWPAGIFPFHVEPVIKGSIFCCLKIHEITHTEDRPLLSMWCLW